MFGLLHMQGEYPSVRRLTQLFWYGNYLRHSLTACMALLGWFFFTIFAAVGLIAVPMDLINAYVNRPQFMSTQEFATQKKALKKKCLELLKIGEQIDAENRKKSKDEKSASEMIDRQTMNQYKAAGK